MSDFAYEIYENIHNRIEESVADNSKIQAIMNRIAKGKATHVDTENFATQLGKLSAKAIQSSMKELDGNLLFGTAAQTVGSTLTDNYVRVNRVAAQIQDALNKEANLGLKSVKAKLNRDRVEGLCEYLAKLDVDEANELAASKIVNITQSFADEFIKANADFQYEAGLTPTITRSSALDCCPWCAEMEGEYEYPVDEDIYRRHDNCRCIIEFRPRDGRGVQNTHTKEWRNDPEDLERRKTIGL